MLVYCNLFDNTCQHDSRIPYRFIPNKSFGEFLKFQHQNFIFLNMSNSDCLYIKVWSTDQNFKPLRIEKRIKLTLVFN